MADVKLPSVRDGNSTEEKIRNLQDTVEMLKKELQYLLLHVDSTNVTDLNTNITKIKSSHGETQIKGPLLLMYDKQANPVLRVKMGYDKDSEEFVHQLLNAFGEITYYVDTSGELIVERGTFKGKITIGTGNNIIKADPASGFWIGHAEYASAPFKVNMSGQAEATDLKITGGSITGVTITIGSGNDVFKVDSQGIRLGNTLFAEAPFKVAMNGAATATNFTIIGGTIKTAADGNDRIVFDGAGLTSYNSANQKEGLAIETGDYGFSRIALYALGALIGGLEYNSSGLLSLFTALGSGVDMYISPDVGRYCYPGQTWDCDDAAIINLKDSLGNPYATQTWVNSQGYLTSTSGATGSFTSQDGKVVAVSNGLIISIT